MNAPIYEQLAEETGVHVPDPLDADPLASLLPVTDSATVTTALPTVRGPDTDRYPLEDMHQHGDAA